MTESVSIPSMGIVNADLAEESVSKISPRSMESGDDTGDDMSVSYPSPSMIASGKPSPTRIKIVKRKVIVKRQKKQQQQQSPSSSDQQVVENSGDGITNNRGNQMVSDNDNSNTDIEEEIIAVPKPGCRYGAGCTHIADPGHRMKFWHPIVQELTEDEIQSNFICNECGYATKSLKELQLHLKRKTAWSNESLVGCRVNCLVDSKEWLEGYVCQYHKSGKHRVEFRALNEKKWMIMKKTAFYIIERPTTTNNVPYGGEVKDNEDMHDNLAPIEDWSYCEGISIEYAFAQSVLFKICGNSLQETGHLTKGHVCLTDEDKSMASQGKCSFLYGELLPRGANKAMESERLSVGTAKTLFDLGMGTGKILIQAFLQFRNLRYIYGVELAEGRYRLAEEILLRMIDLLGPENYKIRMERGKYIIVMENHPQYRSNKCNGNTADGTCEIVYDGSNIDTLINGNGRVLHFQCGNMFDTVHTLHLADVVMMETDIPHDLYYDLHVLLSHMKDNSRMLSYLDFRKVFQSPSALNLRQLDINKAVSDRYPTSWSVQRGHHFFLWIKTPPEDNSSSNWGMGMIKKQQQQQQHNESEISVPKSDCDSHQSDDSAMDRCLPFYFCTYYFGVSVTTSRVSSPVKPLSKGRVDDSRGAIEIDSNAPEQQAPLSDTPKPMVSEREGGVEKLNTPRQGDTPSPGKADNKKKKKKQQNVDNHNTTIVVSSSPRGESVGSNAAAVSTVYTDNTSNPSQDPSVKTQSIGEKPSNKKKTPKIQLDTAQDLEVPGLNNTMQLSSRSNTSFSDSHAFNPDIRSRLSRSTNNSPRPSPDGKFKGSNKGKTSASTTPSLSPRPKDENVDQRSQPDVCAGEIVIGNGVRNGSEIDNYSNLNILNDQSTQRASVEMESFPQTTLLASQSPKSCEALAYIQRFDEEDSSSLSFGLNNQGWINQGSQQPSSSVSDTNRKSSVDQSVGEFRRDCSDTRRRRSDQDSSCSIQ